MSETDETGGIIHGLRATRGVMVRREGADVKFHRIWLDSDGRREERLLTGEEHAAALSKYAARLAAGQIITLPIEEEADAPGTAADAAAPQAGSDGSNIIGAAAFFGNLN